MPGARAGAVPLSVHEQFECAFAMRQIMRDEAVAIESVIHRHGRDRSGRRTFR